MNNNEDLMKNKYLNSIILLLLSLWITSCSCSNPTSSDSDGDSNSSTYSVLLNSNGGTAIVTQEIVSGSKVTEPPSPTKSGFSFTGWYSDSLFTKKWDFAQNKIIGDTTLWAQWSSGTTLYTVSFNSNGGTLTNSVYIDSGSTVNEPTAPLKEGSVFIGWFKDTGLSQSWNFSQEYVSSDTTLFAKWNTTATLFTVLFNSNGGSEIPSQEVDSGAILLQPPSPIKSGYSFIGWFTDVQLTEQWDFTQQKIISDSILYAKWKGTTTGGSPMILKFNLANNPNNPNNHYQVDLPLGTVGTAVDVIVDWGDGAVTEVTEPGVQRHPYDENGIYTVTISGNLEHFGFSSSSFPLRDNLSEIVSFGELGTTSFHYAFTNTSLSIIPPLPSTITDLSYAFYAATSVPDISQWNTAAVTNMEGLFHHCHEFDGDIGEWNTSNVTNMKYMFASAQLFNQPIGNWNTQNVTTMEHMFWSTSFNQPIGNWNTQNVTTMENMFLSSSFNQPIGDWNTANVTNMRGMFNSARYFNQPIEKWNTSSVTSMYVMFWNAKVFNQPIGNWNTSNVTNMKQMFRDAVAFNQPLENWNIEQVISCRLMFNGAINFNGSLANWNPVRLDSTDNMFYNADSFNQPIGHWNTENITSMPGMFQDADSFNQSLANWNVQNVLSMQGMFSNTKDFNQNCSGWTLHQYCNIRSIDVNAKSWQDSFKPSHN